MEYLKALGMVLRGDPLGAARLIMKDGLWRAKVLGLVRDVAKSAAAATVPIAGAFLLNHGFNAQDAATYSISLGGMVAAVVIWLGSVALTWLDKDKVDVQLQVAAATGKIVPVGSATSPIDHGGVTTVDDLIAQAKDGRF